MNGEQIMAIVLASIAGVTVTIGVIAVAWASRRRQGDVPAQRLDALEQRLARMEQAIDTVSVEVERIGEAHRFTARLLADRVEGGRSEAQPSPRTPGRVITPH